MTLPILTPGEDQYWTWPDGSPILWGEEYQMSYRLFDLTYKIAQALSIVQEGRATGGTTTTIIDTNNRYEENNFWNRGTVWILRNESTPGAAPEGEYRTVRDSNAPTSTITLVSALSAPVAAGYRYAIGRRNMPIGVIEQKINQAILELGIVPVVDTTSLQIANNQTEYTLPTAAKQDLRRVYLQTNPKVSDNQWMEIGFEKDYTSEGNPDRIILERQYTAGYALKLVYMADHPPLYTAGAVLSEYIPVELIAYPAILSCWQWLAEHNRTREFDTSITTWANKAAEAKQIHKVIAPSKRSRILSLGFSDHYYPGDRTPR